MSFLNFFHRQDDGGSPYQDRPHEEKLGACAFVKLIGEEGWSY